MTTMISELYEALVDAGASEKKAKEAAEVLSTENLSTKGDVVAVKKELAGNIEKLGARVTELGEKLGARIAKLERDTAVMKWMIGATLAGIVSILAGVASILIKVFSLV